MKRYSNPEIEIIEINSVDVIRTSEGTETDIRDENDGVWDLDIG